MTTISKGMTATFEGPEAFGYVVFLCKVHEVFATLMYTMGPQDISQASKTCRVSAGARYQ